MRDKKQIGEAVKAMTPEQQLIVAEIISMAILKGIETGVIISKDKSQMEKVEPVHMYYMTAFSKFMVEYDITD